MKAVGVCCPPTASTQPCLCFTSWGLREFLFSESTAVVFAFPWNRSCFNRVYGLPVRTCLSVLLKLEPKGALPWLVPEPATSEASAGWL